MGIHPELNWPLARAPCSEPLGYSPNCQIDTIDGGRQRSKIISETIFGVCFLMNLLYCVLVISLLLPLDIAIVGFGASTEGP